MHANNVFTHTMQAHTLGTHCKLIQMQAHMSVQQGTKKHTDVQWSVHWGTVRLALRITGAFTEVRRELALGYTRVCTEALKVNKERALSFMGACTERAPVRLCMRYCSKRVKME